MIILGLGSNMGDRVINLETAIHALSETAIHITAVSPIYESTALLKKDAPQGWDRPYLNMTIMGETHLPPQTLLAHIKRTENKMGRQDRGVWAPREIDIDILAYENMYVNDSNLKIPHAGLCQRAFALLPLVDLVPNWRYPGPGAYAGKTAYEIVKLLPQNAVAHKTPYTLNIKKKHMVA